jgi:hypothetical protein
VCAGDGCDRRVGARDRRAAARGGRDGVRHRRRPRTGPVAHPAPGQGCCLRRARRDRRGRVVGCCRRGRAVRRPADHPGELCRRSAPAPDHRDLGRGVPPRRRPEPHRHLPGAARRRPAPRRRRCGGEHLLPQRGARHRRPGCVRRLEVRRVRAHPGGGARARGPGHPGQRGLPGKHRDADHRHARLRRHRLGRLRAHDPARPARPAGRGRARGSLPRLRREPLRDRHRPGDRRRHRRRRRTPPTEGPTV